MKLFVTLTPTISPSSPSSPSSSSSTSTSSINMNVKGLTKSISLSTCILSIPLSLLLVIVAMNTHSFLLSRQTRIRERQYVRAPVTATDTTATTTATTTTKTHCIVYDRPPRTGSSTISGVLSQCMRQKGYYRQPSASSEAGRAKQIGNMLTATDNMRTSCVTGHLTMTELDVRQLRQRCGEMLYISSTSTIDSRIASQIKYSLLKGHGNFSISYEKLMRALERGISDERIMEQEEFLEKYPYDNSKMKMKLTPDYVIRRSALESDLDSLLNALNCSGLVIKKQNVHSVEKVTETKDEKDVKDLMYTKISSALRYNDSTFQLLSGIAEEKNDIGLEKAKLF